MGRIITNKNSIDNNSSSNNNNNNNNNHDDDDDDDDDEKMGLQNGHAFSMMTMMMMMMMMMIMMTMMMILMTMTMMMMMIEAFTSFFASRKSLPKAQRHPKFQTAFGNSSEEDKNLWASRFPTKNTNK